MRNKMSAAKYAIAIILFVWSVGSGKSEAQAVRSRGESQIALSVELIRSKKTELLYRLELQNKGSIAIYYSGNPQLVGGEYSPYISLDDNDKSILNVQWRVFDPNIVSRIENGGVNNTGVELKRLEPGITIKETVALKWPVSETVPPHVSMVYRKIERDNVKRIRFTMGYFDEDEGITEFLKRKPFGWFIKGYEVLETGLFRGKTFYEIQKILATETYVP